MLLHNIHAYWLRQFVSCCCLSWVNCGRFHLNNRYTHIAGAMVAAQFISQPSYLSKASSSCLRCNFIFHKSLTPVRPKPYGHTSLKLRLRNEYTCTHTLYDVLSFALVFDWKFMWEFIGVAMQIKSSREDRLNW